MIQKEFYFESCIDKVGRLVIPMPIRRQHDIKAGDVLRFVATKEGILLIPVKEENTP